MLSSPVMSTSHALGLSDSLIMLISVQGMMPKNSCKLVQHWIAVPSRRKSCIHRSTTRPNFAIFTSDSVGTPPTDT